MPSWGCIADDVTGATDLATNFVGQGFRTAVFFGVPTRATIEAVGDLDVAVVALKSRTAPTEVAVEESLGALEALRAAGAERYYVKYCSTFDSTADGNIGPVIDAVLGALGERATIVVPSFPDAERTVYRGRLFVGDEPLDESPMRHHPLTPMRDDSLVRLLQPQTTAAVRLITLPTVRRGADVLRRELDRATAETGGRVAVVVDAIDRSDLETIMSAANALRVVTGGSGLAQGLTGPSTDARDIPATPGRRAVLAGSASARTREQIAAAAPTLPSRKLDIPALRRDLHREVAAITSWAEQLWGADPAVVPLVFSVATLDDVTTSEGGSELVERALAAVAARFVELGARQLIVAGGETSGRVVQELGVTALRIGPAISAGVAWSAGTTSGGVHVSLALKSGNFGAPDMFESAWSALPEEA
jgi:uncharacterized protein YgbK (DUF1537 family)